MSKITTINPYTQEKLETYTTDTDEDIVAKIAYANQYFKSWRRLPISERCKKFKKLAEVLDQRKEQLALKMVEEMGKPITQAKAEIEKCIWLIEFYITNAEDFLADRLIETDAQESFISYDPLGVILGVMPWNYPFWQAFRFVVPTLLVGNTVILKHASNVTGCALEIEAVFKEAGFSEKTFQTLIVSHDQIEKIVGHSDVRAVSLTGSEPAGRAVAAAAGKHLKKSVLELGGNNACIVLKDANLDKYLKTMVWARMQNTGQSCIAAKRFIVEERIYDEFLLRFKSEVEQLQIGDPKQQETDISVLARVDLAEGVEKQVDASVDLGAEIVYGKKREEALYHPTIITNVTSIMPVFKEEVFGPVAAIIKVKNAEEAFDLANKSSFGLGTMVFSEAIEQAKKQASFVDDGAYFINEMVKSDPRLPFGGTKASGYGRELSREGILEFTNAKTVYIKT